MLYRFAWMLCKFFLRAVRGIEIHGKENIPMQGGVVLVSNHRSYWDPVVIGTSVPKERPVYFMAKSELFKIPLLGPVIKKLGTFPVKRGGSGDRSAVRTALNLLSKGEIVGIFPEGTRSKSEDLLDPHLGAAMLATRAGVPVLPVAITGSSGFFGRVKIVFGSPMHFKPEGKDESKRVGKDELINISSVIMDRVASLMGSER
jgi:1-acyl-sn-glycerol-3-phosphate acyltransferase